MSLSPQQFRRLYHRMLEPRPQAFHIAAQGDDPWGIVITRTVISGLQVWHSLYSCKVTLALTTPETRAMVPENAIPPGSIPELSASGWRMFRWHVPKVDGTSPPTDQPEMTEVIATVRSAFDWFRATRIDLNG